MKINISPRKNPCFHFKIMKINKRKKREEIEKEKNKKRKTKAKRKQGEKRQKTGIAGKAKART